MVLQWSCLYAMVLSIMHRLLCLIIAVCTLVVAQGWSVDGHATSPEDHVEPAIEMPMQAPDSPQPDCDHHCHFGTHVLGLIVTNTEQPAITTSSVFENHSFRFADLVPSRPERPPSC